MEYSCYIAEHIIFAYLSYILDTFFQLLYKSIACGFKANIFHLVQGRFLVHPAFRVMNAKIYSQKKKSAELVVYLNNH